MRKEHRGQDMESTGTSSWTLDAFPEKTITQILCEVGFVHYLHLTPGKTKLVEETIKRLYMELSGNEPTTIGGTLYLYPYNWHARLGAIAKAISEA